MSIRHRFAQTSLALLLFGPAIAIALPAPSTQAFGFKVKREKINADGTIDVYSQFGDRGYRTPVRHNKFGRLEVYVPKWGWEQCGPTCAYTVQKYSLDFWDNQTEGGLGVGYLSLDLSR